MDERKRIKMEQKGYGAASVRKHGNRGASSFALTASASDADYVNTDTYFPICDDPITISVSGMDGNDGADWNETDLVQYISESMGINMDCNQISAESWPTQLTLMLSSDDLPDLLLNVSQEINVVNEYGEEGFLLNIADYLDIMPNFSAFLEEHEDYASVVTDSDGNIYGLTRYTQDEQGVVNRFFLNQTWLNNLGLEVPETLDELYDVLVAFKEQDANGNGDPDDEIPLTCSDWSMLRAFLPMFGIYSRSIDYSLVADDDGTVSLAQASTNYQEMLRFLNQLYDEGLFDNEGLVHTSDEFIAKVAADQVGLFDSTGAPYIYAGEDPSYDANFVYLAGLASDYNEETVIVTSSKVETQVRVMVSVDTEYPEAICRLLDYLYTEDGALMAHYGILGVGVEMEPVDYLDGVEVAGCVNLDPDTYASDEEYRYKKGIINNGMNVLLPSESTMPGIMAEMDEEELYNEDLLNDWGWRVLTERARRQFTSVEEFPTLVYTSDESSTRSTLKTDIVMYVEQAFGQFVTGEMDIDEDWDTYISILEQNGLSELLEIEQAAYDRYLGE